MSFNLRQCKLRQPSLTLVGCSLLFVIWFLPYPVEAGGQLRNNDFTGFPNLEPGPVAGSLMVPQVPIRWDVRCLPAHYRLNTLASPNSSPVLDADSTRATLQTALDAWNDIPTSYIDLQMGEEEVQRPRSGPFDYWAFDFVNEVNFLSGGSDGWVAISPSASVTFSQVYPAGFDLDFDGDSDFFDPLVEGLETCADVDGDGDTEFPAGFYEAGTILDNDVSFNNSVTWTTGAPNAVFRDFDLEGTAVHEFGHSHGLAHSAINQHSQDDGNGPSMYPLIFSTDPSMQEALRSPSQDDVAWSSFVYPEGSDDDGLPALQPGDVAFDSVFGILSGEITDGETDLPLAGGHLFAIDRFSGEIVTSAYTGRVRTAFIPTASFFGVLPDFPEAHLVGSEYALPVPEGHYHLAIEALDGAPVFAGNVGWAPTVGDFFGQLDFDEQFLTEEDHPKLKPRRLRVEAGETLDDVDHAIRPSVRLDGFDTVGVNASFDFDQLGFFGAPPETLYAVEIPAGEVSLLLDAGLEPTGAAFRTWVLDSSTPVIFGDAALVRGERVDGVVALDLHPPIAKAADIPGQGAHGFLGQENDFSPLFFDNPRKVARDLERAIDHGAESFYLVLQLPETFIGPQNAPPGIGLDFGQAIGQLERSYFSTDGGGTFVPIPTVNFMFRLIFE